MAVMKVETDIASIKENLIGGGVILVIVYVKTFKSDRWRCDTSDSVCQDFQI